MESEREIGDFLSQIGRKLQNTDDFNDPTAEQEDLRKAKDGTKELHRLTTSAHNPEVRADAYVLWTLLDDMWDNIAMVPSTHIEDEEITNLLEPMGEALENIGDQYEQLTRSEFYKKFTGVYDSYLAVMTAINKGLNEEVAK